MLETPTFAQKSIQRPLRTLNILASPSPVRFASDCSLLSLPGKIFFDTDIIFLQDCFHVLFGVLSLVKGKKQTQQKQDLSVAFRFMGPLIVQVSQL